MNKMNNGTHLNQHMFWHVSYYVWMSNTEFQAFLSFVYTFTITPVKLLLLNVFVFFCPISDYIDNLLTICESDMDTIFISLSFQCTPCLEPMSSLNFFMICFSPAWLSVFCLQHTFTFRMCPSHVALNFHWSFCCNR